MKTAGKEAQKLRALEDGCISYDRKYSESLKIVSGFCDKSAAGAFVVGLFQSNPDSLIA
ncbi:MAG: hypothetical protein LBR80_06120 [Deltaproteobacteria bacterium]|nr:hypothetical protein [Deltaproteobacteria bacterium]